MTAISFSSPQELASYVVTNTVAHADIVQIIEKDGQWWLFHF